MDIGDLRLGMSNVSVTGEVVEISDTRVVNTRYGKRRVADATIKDSTGEVKLSLWEDKINLVSVGDKIKVTGAFVSSFKDEIQLNVPRSGRIEKL